MTAAKNKKHLDDAFAGAPRVSFTRYIRDRKNYTSWNQGTGYTLRNLDEDSQLLATMSSLNDEQLFLVRTANGAYHLVEENSQVGLVEPRPVEDDGEWYEVALTVDPEQDTYEEVRCGFEDLVVYSVTEQLYLIENWADRPTEKDAEHYPLDAGFPA